MSLIKASTNPDRTVRRSGRMQEPNRDNLMFYDRFIGDTADYVLNQLIASTIGKDRDFVVSRAAQGPGAIAVSSDAIAQRRFAATRISSR